MSENKWWDEQGEPVVMDDEMREQLEAAYKAAALGVDRPNLIVWFPENPFGAD